MFLKQISIGILGNSLKKQGGGAGNKRAPTSCLQTVSELGRKIKMLEKGWTWRRANTMMEEEKRPDITQGLVIQK